MKSPLRILWLKTGPLHPLDTGGKLRTYNMLQELNRRHPVHYVSLCPPETDAATRAAAGEYSQAQTWIPWRERRKGSVGFYAELAANLGSGLPYVIAKYRSRAMTAAVRRLAASHDLVVCDFLTPAVNLRGAGVELPSLLFQHNVEALIWQRLRDNARGWLKRRYITAQWRRLARFEREAAADFDGVVAVSEEDAALMRRDYALGNVLGAVPTGVDTESYQPPTGPRPPQTLVFLGSMDWLPNIEGIRWFAETGWPLLRQKHPAATLTIVGRRPTAAVRELAARDPSIRVTGTVDDVRPHLAQAAVMIVPLRVGGGTRIKIFEGMATGIPVVSTRIGAEGLAVADGEHLLLADTPAELAAAVGGLWARPGGAQRMGAAGRELVRSRFSWPKVTDVFEQYCLAVAGRERKTA
jgi:glycosyltransferase involved in cell wall biosynthesis